MELIAFGGVFLELVFGHIERLPGPGEEIFTDEFAISCGGAVSCATAARRQGMAAGIASLLGDDLGSRVLFEHCQKEGIDLSTCARVRGSVAGITVVLNFADDRAFVSHVPGRGESGDAELARWWTILERERPSWAYLHAGPKMVPFLRRARELGTRVVVDLNFESIERGREEVIECVRLADVFVPNESELCRLTGLGPQAALEAALEWATPAVVKRGSQGAVVLADGRAETVTEGLRPVVVRDRTGAGDAFAGAMIAALGRGESLVGAAAVGNAAGSEAVARLGAVGEVVVEGLTIAPELLGAAKLRLLEGIADGGDRAEEERR